MNIGVLSEDLLREILVRLPVKSLLKFCCVSKAWCDLINSPYFADMRLGHSKNHRVFLIMQCLNDEKKALLSFHSDYLSPSRGIAGAGEVAPNLKLPSSTHSFSSLRLFGSCNGIVCLAELVIWSNYDLDKFWSNSDSDKIYLCNLATRQFLTLPPSPFGCPDEFMEVQISTTGLGLGFDPSTKDYKLVKFIEYFFAESSAPPVGGVQIYQLRTNSWRKLEGDVSGPSAIVPCQCFPVSILINGFLIMHWCATYMCDNLWHGILSFNMSTEAFQKIELPPCDKPGRIAFNLAVLNDSLAFILFGSRFSEPPPILTTEHSIDIWVMMEYGIKESWVKKYSIHPFSLSGCAPLRVFAPCSSWNNDILLLESENGHFISCSLKDNNCQEICKYSVCKYRLGCIESLVYEETLVSFAGISDGLHWKKM
ncbi:hypothetical protein ACH5RR_037940 [Cinchona calisaya]|uniref:F-box domain-containing protein n=1 Tax=Cinchona calisaya TaxID=153742 RepID=A0ABD2Y8Z9_9GENT